MFKNIFMTIFIHLLVGFIMFYSFAGLGIWINSFHSIPLGISLFIFGLILYMFFSFKLLNPLKSKAYTILSISVVSICSIIIWLIIFFAFSDMSVYSFQEILWIPYVVFNFYIFPIYNVFNINNTLIALIFSFIPIIIFFIAIEIKSILIKSKSTKPDNENKESLN